LPSLGVAVVQDGSIATQRVVTGSLSDIAARVQTLGLRSPSLTIVGEVVSLHRSLAWFRPDLADTPL
jgi:uroporphyrin-III C-methyltransferase/precorrin-2 dehydrogenase/sirohydrochlorin ferrochelatase